ncbi:unnamed protein product [Urochloa humidicola]
MNLQRDITPSLRLHNDLRGTKNPDDKASTKNNHSGKASARTKRGGKASTEPRRRCILPNREEVAKHPPNHDKGVSARAEKRWQSIHLGARPWRHSIRHKLAERQSIHPIQTSTSKAAKHPPDQSDRSNQNDGGTNKAKAGSDGKVTATAARGTKRRQSRTPTLADL